MKMLMSPFVLKGTMLLMALSACLYGCQSMFFHPSKPLFYRPEICERSPRDMYIEKKDGTMLHAWYFLSNVTPSRGTVIFFHGNGGNLSTEVPSVLWLLDKGYDIFTADYSGYGISAGKPAVKTVLDDGLEILDGFSKLDGPERGVVILYGQSMGAAVAAYASAYSPHADKVDLLILDSPFYSWRGIVRETAGKFVLTWPFQYPASWFFPKEDSPENTLPLSKAKNVIISHSVKDALVGIKNAEMLYEITDKPKYFLKDDYAEHAAIFNNPFNRKRLTDIMDEILKN